VCPPCRATGAYCGTGTQWNGQLCIATQGDAPPLPVLPTTATPAAIPAACQTATEGGTGVGIVIGMLLMFAIQKAMGGGGGKAKGGTDALEMGTMGNPTSDSMYAGAAGDVAL